jgi:hypothetical protein
MRHVVHKEVMDTLQDIKEILDITNTHTLYNVINYDLAFDNPFISETYKIICL